jgi:hypothetical protein
MRTVMIIVGGLALFAVLALIGVRFSGATVSMAAVAKWFIPIWLVLASINMWIGVTRAGYSVGEELPIFLVIFALPAAVAALCWWRFS